MRNGLRNSKTRVSESELTPSREKSTTLKWNYDSTSRVNDSFHTTNFNHWVMTYYIDIVDNALVNPIRSTPQLYVLLTHHHKLIETEPWEKIMQRTITLNSPSVDIYYGGAN